MNRKKHAILAALFALFLLPLTVFAGKPDVEFTDFLLEGFLPSESHCEIFGVEADWSYVLTGTDKETTFYNNDGSWKKTTHHVEAVEIVTNPNNGKYVVSDEIYKWTEFPDGTNKITGLFRKIIDPVGNQKIFDVGVVVWDSSGIVHLGGPKMFDTYESYAEAMNWICTAIAD